VLGLYEQICGTRSAFWALRPQIAAYVKATM
jgi:hypothetical protein